MSTLPYSLEPGTLADADEVQSNFDWIMSIIGPNSTPSKWSPVSNLILGVRDNMQIVGSQDVAPGGIDDDFMQASYNAELFKDTDGRWRNRRFYDGEPVVATRWGRNGFEVLTTSLGFGNLPQQMFPVFSVTARTSGADYMFLDPNFHIVSSHNSPQELQDHRLTMTPLNVPITVLGGGPETEGVKIYDASSLGVPRQAVGLHVSARIYARDNGATDTRMFVTQDRDQRHEKYGIVAIINGGTNGTATAEGFVPLGRDSRDNRFAIDLNMNVNSAAVFIKGYYL